MSLFLRSSPHTTFPPHLIGQWIRSPLSSKLTAQTSRSGVTSQHMSDNVLSHNEMCRREGISLQRGMNFGLGGNHSVILMSMRRNAPYRDRLEDGGTTLIYEGHDHPKVTSCPNPKAVSYTHLRAHETPEHLVCR